MAATNEGPTVSTGPDASQPEKKEETVKSAQPTATAVPETTAAVPTSSAPETEKVESTTATASTKETSEPTVTNGPETTTTQTTSKAADTPAATSPTTAKSEAGDTTVVGTEATSKPSQDVGDDEVNPLDFAGEVETNNDLPGAEVLRKIEDYTVLDESGKSVPFKSIYNGRNVARRVLVIFVRHFLCGNCQEYIRTLSQDITPESLLRLPISTFIAVVGCGDPAMIPHYQKYTSCPFPIYADPTRRLFDELGMVRTLSLGSRPAYMKKSVAKSIGASIFQGLKLIKSGLVTKVGDSRQVGGEFLFEPLSLATPVSTPQAEEYKPLGEDKVFAAADVPNGSEAKTETTTNGGTTTETPDAGLTAKELETTETNGASSHHRSAEMSPPPAKAKLSTESTHIPEEKRITWCHRMRTTRDHAEMPEIRDVLGLDGEGQPIKNQKRWEAAKRSRKGTGLSMASRMNSLKRDGIVPS